MQSVEHKVLNRIYGYGRGRVFTPNDFLDLGNRSAIQKALTRLQIKGNIRRLTRGIYDYPIMHSEMGFLQPSPDAIAKALGNALAGKHNIQMQPAGAYAANLLGFSTQVPAKIVFLTDGPSKAVRIGKQEIRLQHTTPRFMATAGRVSGLIIQALRYLGKNQVDDKILATIRRKIKADDNAQILKDIAFAPTWIGKHMRKILEPA